MEYGFQEQRTGLEGVAHESTLRALAAHPSAGVCAAASEELRRRAWRTRTNAPSTYTLAMEGEHQR